MTNEQNVDESTAGATSAPNPAVENENIKNDGSSSEQKAHTEDELEQETQRERVAVIRGLGNPRVESKSGRLSAKAKADDLKMQEAVSAFETLRSFYPEDWEGLSFVDGKLVINEPRQEEGDMNSSTEQEGVLKQETRSRQLKEEGVFQPTILTAKSLGQKRARRAAPKTIITTATEIGEETLRDIAAQLVRSSPELAQWKKAEDRRRQEELLARNLYATEGDENYVNVFEHGISDGDVILIVIRAICTDNSVLNGTRAVPIKAYFTLDKNTLVQVQRKGSTTEFVGDNERLDLAQSDITRWVREELIKRGFALLSHNEVKFDRVEISAAEPAEENKYIRPLVAPLWSLWGNLKGPEHIWTTNSTFAWSVECEPKTLVKAFWKYRGGTPKLSTWDKVENTEIRGAMLHLTKILTTGATIKSSRGSEFSLRHYTGTKGDGFRKVISCYPFAYLKRLVERPTEHDSRTSERLRAAHRLFKVESPKELKG